MYKINVEFQTGNSFGSHVETGDIEHEWEDLEIAKKNLARIKEHWDWYYQMHKLSFSRKKIATPAYTSDDEPSQIMLILDSGEEWPYGAFWIGYFEALISASIVMPSLTIKG